MCGRFTHLYKWKQLHELMELIVPVEIPARYNVAPTQLAPVVRMDEGGARRLDMLRWGFVPAWAKEVSERQPINARSETAAASPAFRSAMKRRRCIVPASGFFEWQATGGMKRPWYIRPKGGEIFAMAGVWEAWTDGVTRLETFAVLTTGPNDVMRPLHSRMPVMLGRSDFAEWLTPEEMDAGRLAAVCAPCDASMMEAVEVSTWVNSPAHDDARCIEPCGTPSQRGLFEQ